MAKKTNPIITHTEILNRAIHDIEGEIESWQLRCEGLPEDLREKMFDSSTKELRAKLDAMKTLYSIETGTDYV